jgi:hypothetical protein
MMRRNYTRLCGAGLILFIAGFLLSCSEGDFTIFYQVINEKAIQDNDLDNTLSVQGMERVDLTTNWSQPNRYYIAAGKIFTRTVTSDNWDSVSNQTDNDERLCNGLAFYGVNTLFGSFYSVDGKHYGLYRVSIDAAFAASPKDIAWTPVTDGNVAGKRIGSLKVVNGVLFISVRDGDEYSLVSFNGSYSIVEFNEPPLLTTDKLPVPVRDVTFDGGNFWCITGSKIYKGSSLSVTQEPGTPTVSGDERFEGIVHTSNGNIYLSTSRGIIWLYSGGTWTSRHFDYQASSAVKDDVWFTQFLEVQDTGGSPVHMVVVGTHGAGFFEINDGAADPLGSIERFANTSKKELYSGSAGGFFVADVDDNYAFFVLTLGSGLWRSRLKDGNWESWTWE